MVISCDAGTANSKLNLNRSWLTCSACTARNLSISRHWCWFVESMHSSVLTST